MKDDIETVRELLSSLAVELGIGQTREQAAFERIISDRDSLRKALDDRWTADLKAAKDIFAETGRTSGFPSVKEVLAHYIAEVERLEKERDEAKKIEHQTFMDAASINVENDFLRAKLERAKEALANISGQHLTSEMDEEEFDSADFEGGYDAIVKVARAELSADAPAQQTPSIAAMQEAMKEAEKTLEPLAKEADRQDTFCSDDSCGVMIDVGDLRCARAALQSLRKAMQP